MNTITDAEAAVAGCCLVAACIGTTCVTKDEYIDTGTAYWTIYAAATAADFMAGMAMAVTKATQAAYVVVALSTASIATLAAWKRKTALDTMLTEHQAPLLVPEGMHEMQEIVYQHSEGGDKHQQ